MATSKHPMNHKNHQKNLCRYWLYVFLFIICMIDAKLIYGKDDQLRIINISNEQVFSEESAMRMSAQNIEICSTGDTGLSHSSRCEPEPNPKKHKSSIKPDEISNIYDIPSDKTYPQRIIKLYNLFDQYYRLSDFRSAEIVINQINAFNEVVYGTDHPDSLRSLQNQGNVMDKLGIYDKSEKIYLRLLYTYRAQQTPGNTELIITKINLGISYLKQGLTNKAKIILLEAKEDSAIINELNSNSIILATLYYYLAQMHEQEGSNHEAVEHYKKSLQLKERIGFTQLEISDIRDRLSTLYMTLGLHSKAVPLSIKSLKENIAEFGEHSLETAYSMRSLALLYMYQHKYIKADNLFNKTIDIQSKKIGAIHPEVSVTLNNLAASYILQSKDKKAMFLLNEANRIYEINKLKSNINRASIFNNMGIIYMGQGQYSKAESSFLKSLKVYQVLNIESHPHSVKTMHRLAILYLKKGFFNQALLMKSRAIKIYNAWIRTEAISYSVGNRLIVNNSFRSVPSIRDDSTYLIPMSTEFEFNSRLNRKGILLEIEQKQLILARQQSTNMMLLDQLKDLIEKSASPFIEKDNFKNLQEEKEKIETDLYQRLPTFEISELSSKEIASLISSKGVLIEYFKYQSMLKSSNKSILWSQPHYMATILKSNGTISSISLGKSSVIDDSIARALKASSENLKDSSILWRNVSNQLLGPLKKHLSYETKILIVPDSELNRIPFAALSSPLNPDEPLGITNQLQVLNSTRELLRNNNKLMASSSPLVMANPNFNNSNSYDSANTKHKSKGITLTSKARIWDPLPNSSQEGEAIADILGVPLLQGNDASASRLKEVSSPKIIHIASHGLFGSRADSQELYKSSLFLSEFYGDGIFKDKLDPMFLGSIVLAGANNLDGTGYITAAEIAGLNLGGTELVVLSTCDSGYGYIQTGEGIYGLQRALAIAGARSTLLSLWKVDDSATKAFMIRFYTLLKEGKNRSNALIETQREFRKHPNGIWQDPYYWAGWQLVGDWEPIQGI